jgi:hypothetical protein
MWVSPRKHAPSCPLALATALLNTLEDDPGARVDMRGLLRKLDAAADELAEETSDEEDEARELPPPASAAAAPGPAVAAPSPPSIVAPSAASGTWPRTAIAGALAVLLGGFVMWQVCRQSPAPQVSEPQTTMQAEPAEALSPSLPTMPRAAEVSTPAPPPMPLPAPLPTMRAALDGAAAELRRCSELAGGLLLVEFETAPDRSEFARVLARSSDAAIRRCVDAAVRSARFEPTDAQTFTEEYTP